jgi:hypothetical protein
MASSRFSVLHVTLQNVKKIGFMYFYDLQLKVTHKILMIFSFFGLLKVVGNEKRGGSGSKLLL